MAVMKIKCPSCTASLKSGAVIAVGTKIKCPKCGGGFVYSPEEETAEYAEVAERDDEVDEEEEQEEQEEVRPKKRLKKKKRKDNKLVVMAISIGAAVVLLAGGGYAAYRFLRTPDFAEPLAFVPASSNVIIGADVERLVTTLGMQSQIEQFLSQGNTGFTEAECKQQTGLEFLELFNQVTIAVDSSSGGAGLANPKAVTIVRSKVPFSPSKVEKLLKLREPTRLNGRKYYTRNDNASVQKVFMPSSRLIVIVDSGAQNELNAIIGADGTKMAVSAALQTKVESSRQNEIWAVATIDTNLRNMLAAAGTQPDARDSKQFFAALQHVTGAGVWLNSEGGQVKLNAHIECDSASAAALLSSEWQKSFEKETKGLGGAAKLAVGLAMMPPSAQTVVRELIQSIRFGTQGSSATLYCAASLQAVLTAITELQQFAAALSNAGRRGG